MRRPHSLRTHLFAATTAVVVLSVGLMLAIGSVLTRRAVERATLKDVSHQADLIAGREQVSLLPGARLKQLKPYLKAQHESFARPSLRRPSVYLRGKRLAAVRRGRPVDGTVTTGGTTYFFAARKLGKQQAFVLRRPKSLGNSAFYPFLFGLLIAALAGATLAALAAFLLARRIARPVRRVVAATRHLAEERTPEHVPVEGAAEIATLARAFNDLADELARARAAEKQFLLSVSHELKTPLTAIRGWAEGVADGAFDPDEAAATIVRESARLERLVRDLLDLARMNRTDFSFHRDAIDLADVARETVARYDAQARDFSVTLEAFAPAAAPATGDFDRLVQIASNLVENALRIIPAGGVVRVLAEPGVLTVEDTGPGLRAEELPRAFERFYLFSRYGDERPVGTGLGLAIVKELTEGMGGTVAVESEPGHGARFVVRLPESTAFYGSFTSGEPGTDAPTGSSGRQAPQEVKT